MKRISFKQRKNLSEYLDKNELKQIEWIESTSVRKANDPVRIIFPDLEDNKLFFNKMQEFNILTKEDERLDFFDWLYYTFFCILNHHKNPYKAISEAHPFWSWHKTEYRLQNLLYYYSICFLINRHCSSLIVDLVDNLNEPNIMQELEHQYIDYSSILELNVESVYDTYKPFLNFSNQSFPAGLKMRQVALLCFYNQKRVTSANASRIASNYGFKSLYSGKKLLGFYREYALYTTSRIELPERKKGALEKIELFEGILEYISENGKQRYTDEIKTLKSKLSFKF